MAATDPPAPVDDIRNTNCVFGDATDDQLDSLQFEKVIIMGWPQLYQEDPDLAFQEVIGACIRRRLADVATHGQSAVVVLRGNVDMPGFAHIAPIFLVSRAVPATDTEGLAAARACVGPSSSVHTDAWEEGHPCVLVTFAGTKVGTLAEDEQGRVLFHAHTLLTLLNDDSDS